MRNEGILNEIISQLPIQRPKYTQIKENQGSLIAPTLKKQMLRDDLDPSKRYLYCMVRRGAAFVDFVNVRPDESIQISVSFLKKRWSTK